MRPLNTGDAFRVLQIFRAAGMKDEFAEILNAAFTKKKKEEIGGKLFAVLFDCLGHEKAEPMIVKLLADISGKTPDEVTGQPLKDTIAMLKEIAKQSDMSSFFKDAAASTEK